MRMMWFSKRCLGSGICCNSSKQDSGACSCCVCLCCFLALGSCLRLLSLAFRTPLLLGAPRSWCMGLHPHCNMHRNLHGRQQ